MATETADSGTQAAPAPVATPEMIRAVAEGQLMPAGAAARLHLLEELESVALGLRSPDALRAIARLRAALGDLAGSAASWRTLLGRRVASVADHEHAARAFLAAGAPDDTRSALASVSDEGATPERLALWGLALGAEAGAEALLEALDAYPADATLLAALADLRFEAGQVGLALLTAVQAIASAGGRGTPAPPRALRIKALCLARLEPTEAVQAFADAYEADPTGPAGREQAAFFMEHGRFEDARRLIEDLQTDAPLDDRLARVGAHLRRLAPVVLMPPEENDR